MDGDILPGAVIDLTTEDRPARSRSSGYGLKPRWLAEGRESFNDRHRSSTPRPGLSEYRPTHVLLQPGLEERLNFAQFAALVDRRHFDVPLMDLLLENVLCTDVNPLVHVFYSELVAAHSVLPWDMIRCRPDVQEDCFDCRYLICAHGEPCSSVSGALDWTLLVADVSYGWITLYDPGHTCERTEDQSRVVGIFKDFLEKAYYLHHPRGQLKFLGRDEGQSDKHSWLWYREDDCVQVRHEEDSGLLVILLADAITRGWPSHGPIGRGRSDRCRLDLLNRLWTSMHHPRAYGWFWGAAYDQLPFPLPRH